MPVTRDSVVTYNGDETTGCSIIMEGNSEYINEMQASYNKKNFNRLMYLLLFILIILILFINATNYAQKQQLAYEVTTEEKLAVLHTRMRFLELQYQKKQDEIVRLQARLKNPNEMHEPEASEEKAQFYAKVMTHLKNISDGFPFVEPEAEPEPLRSTLMLTTMRHLLHHPNALCPAFQVLSPRKNTEVDVVIGIPTVKRDKEDYLIQTIESLIDGMTADQLARTLIIVSIGEATDVEFVAATAFRINHMFPSYFGQLIEVISPTEYWYPDWSTVKPSLGDSQKRTQWRTKQNLDAIFLMSYAQTKGTYYLMLEDDILAKNGFMTDILKFAASETVSKPNWFFINFSTIGGIGKFFRTEDLAFFNAYVQVFYMYMPIDWLTEFYLAGRVCGIDKSSQQCGNLKSTIRPTFKTNLFEHAGLFSSLRGKIQKVKPNLRKGKDLPAYYPHKNPPVKRVTSTIQCQKEHTIERAYNGEDFFWGVNPKANDTIEFWFDPPLNIDKFFFGSGNPNHVKDIIQRSVVEVLPETAEADSFLYAAEFDEFGNSEGNIDPEIGRLAAIRIRILEKIPHWIIISEIELLSIETT